ncbi:MAG TPA: ABC transporter permease [Gemmatimonadota bacterium]|jgi:lipopolysaccharide transport system permease protein|nr:ABC transporter permease [Gemmatimonadota bacterium]
MNVTRELDHAAEDRWVTILGPETRWLDFRLGELWRYRDLVALFVRRDFLAQYKQTILGPAWHVIQPLLTTVTFTIVFGRIARIPTDSLPPFLFYFAGYVIWSYFATTLTKVSSTFIANASMFGKVYFPRMAIPVSISISSMIAFGIQFALFLAFLVYFRFRGSPVDPNAWMLAAPIVVLLMGALGLGFGIIVSSLTTRYRDLSNLVTFGVQLLMYATPIVYPLSEVPDGYRLLVLLNPMSSLVEAFRFGFLGAGTVSFGHLAYSFVFTLVILICGVLLFNRVERNFMDTV